MNPAASRFYAIARRLHPELSPSLLRKAAEAFARRNQDRIDPTPGHVSAAIIAHVRHTRTDYNNRWRRDMERYRDIKAVGNAVAATIIDTRFVRRPLPKVAAPKASPFPPPLNLGAVMDAAINDKNS